MCEMCGCGVAKAGPRLAGADAVTPTLAAIPVTVVEPSVKVEQPARRREHGIQDPLLRRAPRSP